MKPHRMRIPVRWATIDSLVPSLYPRACLPRTSWVVMGEDHRRSRCPAPLYSLALTRISHFAWTKQRQNPRQTKFYLWQKLAPRAGVPGRGGVGSGENPGEPRPEGRHAMATAPPISSPWQVLGRPPRGPRIADGSDPLPAASGAMASLPHVLSLSATLLI
jgi:hypothetical protein